MAEPVLLISSDPFLGASLEAVARGRLQIARLDPARRPPAWPASPSATVVLDVAARQRDSVHTWVRRHHAGPLVILLKPGERRPPVPPGPSTTVVARPFRLIELVALLERPPAPPAAREGDAEAVDAGGEPEGEGEPPPVPPGAAGRPPSPTAGIALDPVAMRMLLEATGLTARPDPAVTPPSTCTVDSPWSVFATVSRTAALPSPQR